MSIVLPSRLLHFLLTEELQVEGSVDPFRDIVIVTEELLAKV
jgi:ribosome-binding ATPase YchF (GTP1/OBG family)